ncbi:hypothetical protein D3C87_2185960 [compost metagenome]
MLKAQIEEAVHLAIVLPARNMLLAAPYRHQPAVGLNHYRAREYRSQHAVEL